MFVFAHSFYSGVVFLFRTALVLFTCCKHGLFEATSQDAVMSILLNPPSIYLPSSPDAFVDLALSVKMKDDDVKKQRNKMEAQVKRQTQSRGIDLSKPSISLPRA